MNTIIKLMNKVVLNKTYKYRIYPNDSQRILIEKTFGCVRFIWNKMLTEKEEIYKQTKITPRIYPAKYKKQYEWLKEVDSMALCNVQLCIERAYRNHFENPKYFDFPKYHKKKDNINYYITNYHANRDNIRIEGATIKMPKLGYVKINYHRDIPSYCKIKSAIISRSKTNKYYVSIIVEYEKQIAHRMDTSKIIGIDYSSTNFYVDSNGKAINMPHFYRESCMALAKEQRKLSHMVLHSNNWIKQHYKINKIYEKIKNQRKDFIQKLTTNLINNYDIICLEDIDLVDISQTLNLGKSTMDNGFGLFKEILNQKAMENGNNIIYIDKYFPSSKKCHICGYKNKHLTINDRKWVCPKCGNVHDRDFNAAINIRDEGLRIFNLRVKGDSSFNLVSLENLSEKPIWRHTTTLDCGSD